MTGAIAPRKAELRRAMRDLRRALPDRVRRSTLVTQHVVALDAVASASRFHVYDAVPGEVETAALVAWIEGRAGEVRRPEDDVVPTWADVVIVPGVAFTADGRRLGQGGGWYDRFLVGLRPDATTIGLAFEPQIVEDLPTEQHDVVLDCVVTETGPRWRT